MLELALRLDLPLGVLGERELLDCIYVERRNERGCEHSLQNLEDLIQEGRTS